MSDDQAGQILNQEAERNAAIDGAINRLRNEDPMLEQILRSLVEW